MSESRDPAIKLFGKTISLPASEEWGGDEDKGSPIKEVSPEPYNNTEQESLNLEDNSGPMSSTAEGNSEAAEAEKNSKVDEEHQNDDDDTSGNPQDEKPALKKPDKIIPCPRCNSLDTKFCYYNNYNVNQPRHFCKNCQRYWTAGGTMRNVPVGAGRRKNKNSASSHYRHITMSDALRSDIVSDPIHPLKPTATVLSFGSNSPLHESIASVLNLAENTMKNCNRNGFHRTDHEQMEDQSSGCSAAAAANSNCNDHEATNLQEPVMMRNCEGFVPPPPPPPQVPYINGTPWPYQWSPPPAFCASTFPIPFYPAAAYWGCSTWSVPWLSPMALSPPSNGSSSGSTGPNSPTLGKHSREGDVLLCRNNSSTEKADGINRQSNQERCLWIPKTLRIDDPEEAAKSSIWATMGFKNDKANAIGSRGGGLFKAFQMKGELKNHTAAKASHVLHANPAALSRSFNFQETS